jgi:glycosyltransferase involved in cell wall biosynthesis
MPWLSRILVRTLKPLIWRMDTRATEARVFRRSRESNSLISYFQQEECNVVSEPLVSIIVPNYNHEGFLRRRLDSIYNQTYRNFEVVLLDDASSDGSLSILTEYRDLHPEITRLVINEENSGGVFHQWEKGFAVASGDLIWIAESDDFCTQEFLRSLVGYFSDEAVVLAYARTVFVNSDEKQIWTIEEYLSDLGAERWTSAFAQSAHELVRDAWAVKNIVPNVSSAVFRNPKASSLIHDETWKGMRICGDWLFYLSVIRGGLVVYDVDATNFYCIHDSNTSVATYAKDAYYAEHELVARYTNKHYRVPAGVFERQRKNLIQHWKMTRDSYSDKALSARYDLKRIEADAVLRKPNILMVGYSFAAGGGETFPIMLANLLKEEGYSITYLSCDQEPREAGVRGMLRADIPVVNNYRYLRGIVKAFGVDIIHSHHAWVDNTILDLLPEESDCVPVVSLHGMYEMLDESSRALILPRVCERVGKVIFTADKNVEPFKDMGLYDEDHFVKIGNAIAATPISPFSRKSMGISEDAFVLCLVSRAIPEKGWKEAVEIVRLARELSTRDFQLLLIGEGPEYDSLQAAHPSFVHLLGFRNNIRDYYAGSDFGFLPSRFSGESFPLTIIDCLATGVPVLASDKGEIPSMLRTDDGIAGAIFLLRDGKIPIEEVADIVVDYATNDARYQEAKNAVAAAASAFDPIVMLGQYAEIYGEIYAQRCQPTKRQMQADSDLTSASRS